MRAGPGIRVRAATAVATGTSDALPSNQALLGRLEHAAASRGPRYRPEAVVPSADDRAYFASRAGSLLASGSWEQRNLGIKLIGLLKAQEKTPLLLAILGDKRPAPLIKRMLGGDFAQVGFIRRNIMTALGRLGAGTPDVEAAIVATFSDPYFEARAEAARAVSALAAHLAGREPVIRGLVGLLDDRWMEVAGAAAMALGRVGGAGDALPALVRLGEARYWRLRSAALEGLLALIERGEGGNLEDLRQVLYRFVLTSTDFKPEFQIKRLYGRVMHAIATREGESR